MRSISAGCCKKTRQCYTVVTARKSADSNEVFKKNEKCPNCFQCWSVWLWYLSRTASETAWWQPSVASYKITVSKCHILALVLSAAFDAALSIQREEAFTAGAPLRCLSAMSGPSLKLFPSAFPVISCQKSEDGGSFRRFFKNWKKDTAAIRKKKATIINNSWDRRTDRRLKAGFERP